jgi:hypothetical protein
MIVLLVAGDANMNPTPPILVGCFDICGDDGATSTASGRLQVFLFLAKNRWKEPL